MTEKNHKARKVAEIILEQFLLFDKRIPLFKNLNSLWLVGTVGILQVLLK